MENKIEEKNTMAFHVEKLDKELNIFRNNLLTLKDNRNKLSSNNWPEGEEVLKSKELQQTRGVLEELTLLVDEISKANRKFEELNVNIQGII